MKIEMPEEVNPGDILFDRTGIISACAPATYVVLSSDMEGGKREWRLARFRSCGSEWKGAQVLPMLNEDIVRLEKVGELPTEHLAPQWSKTWKRRMGKMIDDFIARGGRKA